MAFAGMYEVTDAEWLRAHHYDGPLESGYHVLCLAKDGRVVKYKHGLTVEFRCTGVPHKWWPNELAIYMDTGDQSTVEGLNAALDKASHLMHEGTIHPKVDAHVPDEEEHEVHTAHRSRS